VTPTAPAPPPSPKAGERPLRARLRAAFSLRDNVRRLLVPPEGHLRAIDGLRALSILWVIVFHAGWYARFFMPLDAWTSLLLAGWMLPSWRGDFGVDVFFVLSGFLIGTLLLDELGSRGRIGLARFYVRRLFRLWPALLVVLAFSAVFRDDHAGMSWANALYVSNFVPVERVAMGWTWSLSIEEQFYLVCPWLLIALAARSPRWRALALAALCAALAGVTAWVVVRHGLRPWDAEIVTNVDVKRWALAFDVIYDKPWTRGGALLVGVASAALHRAPGFMAALSRARLGGVLVLLLGLATMAAATHWPLAVGASRTIEIAYLASFRTAFAAGVAAVMLLSLSTHPAGRILAWPLSSRLLYPVSQLAYGAYLVNPIVCEYVHAALRGHATSAAGAMLAFMPADTLVTLAVAAALHLLVERPFMLLRPRAPG
jgi:peptidoglycan/LPS O-acetylase OafA/YrhL